MPHRHAGDLQVPDPPGRQVLAQLHRHVAFDDLAVVEVELHLQVRCAEGLHDAVCLVLAVQEVAGHVAQVDRLDQHVPSGRSGTLGRPGDIPFVGGLQPPAVGALRRETCHHVDPRAAERLGIVQRPREAVTELGFAPRQAGDATVTRVPVTGRRVEQHLLQTVVLQTPGDLTRFEGVGEQVLDRLEAVRGGGGEAVEEGVLVV